ncbi:MAG: hypothetical protein ABIU06_14075 [Anaerolineales bacterium]
MNESSLNPKSNEPTSEPKLFGLPRPLAGALIGILLFLIVEFLLWRANLGELAMGLNYPGLFIASLIGLPLDFLIIGISSIPAAIMGSLFSSKDMTPKIFGVTLLLAHVILWIVFSIFFSIMD